MKIKYSPKGVEVTIGNSTETFKEISKLNEIIKQLAEAKSVFLEHLHRLSEESQQSIWESE